MVTRFIENCMNCVIFANGQFFLSAAEHSLWLQADLVIATDGGARHCHALQLIPHLLIGDMDSISSELLDYFTEQGSEVHRFPGRKDKTDLELAIEFAIGRGGRNITILGALGGRWDMSIASVMLLANPELADIAITLHDGPTNIYGVHGGNRLKILGEPGDTLSLIPLTGTAREVNLSGLEYALTDEDLSTGSTRGISNLFIDQQVEIALREGVLLVVHCRKTCD